MNKKKLSFLLLIVFLCCSFIKQNGWNVISKPCAFCNPDVIQRQTFYEDDLVTGQSFHIMPATKTFKLVNLLHHEYFSTLRTKLGWSGSLKT